VNPADRAQVDGRRDGPLGTGVPLGRWAGVPIAAHWSTAATLALFTWLLADSILPSAVPGYARLAYWTVGAVTAVVFLATLLAHEFAHAATSRHYGMKIKRITLWMLGGLTELDGDPPSPRADAWIAAAGPLVSIGIGLVGGALAWAAGFEGLVGAALVWLAQVSVVIGLFNLLPGAPLDGGRLLRAILWRHHRDRARASAGAARAGRVLGTALVALGLVEVVLGGFNGLWLALIGWFILGASNAERHAASLDRLRGTTVAEIMRRNPVTAPNWWTVTHLVDELWSQRPPDTIPVVDFTGCVSGVISLHRLDRVPPAHRDTTRLRDISVAAPTLAPDAEVADCLPALQGGATVVVVDGDGHPLGLISPDELTRTLQLAALRDRAARDGGRHRTAA
jgi:Zn-dependent protease